MARDTLTATLSALMMIYGENSPKGASLKSNGGLAQSMKNLLFIQMAMALCLMKATMA